MEEYLQYQLHSVLKVTVMNGNSEHHVKREEFKNQRKFVTDYIHTFTEYTLPVCSVQSMTTNKPATLIVAFIMDVSSQLNASMLLPSATLTPDTGMQIKKKKKLIISDNYSKILIKMESDTQRIIKIDESPMKNI